VSILPDGYLWKLVENGNPVGWAFDFFVLDVCFLEKFFERRVRIFRARNKTGNTGVDEHFSAEYAGRMRTVDSSVVYGNAVKPGLNYGVLLGMYSSAYLVPLAGRNV